MLEGISSWAGKIVVAVLIGSIIEMLLPDSKNKKYVKTVIGLFILFTILSPIIDQKKDFDLNVALAMEEMESMETNTVSTSQNELIANTYLMNLKSNITATLQEKNYQVTALEIEIDTQETFGKITKITLSATKEEKSLVGTLIPEVNITVGENTIVDDELPLKEKEEIKSILAENYEIEKDIIYFFD